MRDHYCNSNKKVIVATSHLFDGPYRGGMHYFYKYFQDRGFDVTYITIPLSPRLFLGKLGPFYRKLWRTPSTKKHLIHFTPFFPHQILGHSLRKILYDHFLKVPCFDIRKKLQYYGLLEPDIFFCEATMALSLFSCIRPQKFIVRASDSLKDIGFPNDLIDFCIKKASYADLILAVANGIKTEIVMKEISPEKVMILPNGIDISEYTQPLPLPSDYAQLTGPIAVYVGNLNIIDHQFLRQVALILSHVTFFIIGPVPMTFPSLPANLIYAGYKPSDQVPAYLQHANVGIIPIPKKRLGVIERPRKLYQYLAAGIPVVSIKGPCTLPTSYVTYADTVEQFVQHITNQMEHPYDKRQIYAYAKDNFSWETIFTQLDSLIF